MSRLHRTVFLCVAAAAGAGTPLVHADRSEYVAGGCSYAASSDSTGVVSQDSSTQIGMLVVGPAVAADLMADDGSGLSASPSLADTWFRCSVQVNRAENDGLSAATSCDASGTALAYGICTVAFTAFPSDSVYLCGTMWTSTSSSTQEIRFDSDNETPGAQCAPVTSVATASVAVAGGADCYTAAIAGIAAPARSSQNSRDTVLSLQKLQPGSTGDDAADDDRLGSGISCHCSSVSLFNCGGE